MESGLFAIVGLVTGLLIGGLVTWLAVRLRSASSITRLEQEALVASDLRQERDSLRSERDEAARDLASVQASLDSVASQSEIHVRDLQQTRADTQQAREKVASLQQKLAEANRRIDEQGNIEKTLTDQFKVLATEVIDSNSEKFLTAADEKVGTLVQQAKKDFDLSKEAVDQLVKPLSEELKRIETARSESQGSLKQQLEDLAKNNQELQKEAKNLTTALKAPQVRGRWGEIQLHRVVELAGMSNYCDYEEQVSIQLDDGSTDRPDMVVRMPSDRTIVVDAKTPLSGYIEAVESQHDDQQRDVALARHARQVRERAQDLSRKAYWDSLDRSPEFVVMFMPGEFFLQPALERDPELLEWALERRVVIATPNTLVALLRTVELGWREVQLAETAREIGALGQELHDRLAIYAGNFSKVGSSLTSAVRNFNSAVGSFDGRVAVSARRFKELGVPGSADIPEIKEIELQVRDVNPQLTVDATPSLAESEGARIAD